MNKITGLALVAASTFLFILLAAGQLSQPLFGFIPAFGLGITGLKMLRENRNVRQREPTSDISIRLQRIEEILSTVVIDLDSTQTNVQRLSEERAFLERLLAERPAHATQQALTERV